MGGTVIIPMSLPPTCAGSDIAFNDVQLALTLQDDIKNEACCTAA